MVTILSKPLHYIVRLNIHTIFFRYYETGSIRPKVFKTKSINILIGTREERNFLSLNDIEAYICGRPDCLTDFSSKWSSKVNHYYGSHSKQLSTVYKHKHAYSLASNEIYAYTYIHLVVLTFLLLCQYKKLSSANFS